jgi:hypothetical protein
MNCAQNFSLQSSVPLSVRATHINGGDCDILDKKSSAFVLTRKAGVRTRWYVQYKL